MEIAREGRLQRRHKKKQKFTPMADQEKEHRLVAQLVLQFGFSCCGNMISFSTSLDRNFRAWAMEYILVSSVVVCSIANRFAQDCAHKAVVGLKTLKIQVMEARPGKWYHIYKVTADPQPQNSVFQMACTCVVGSKLHSQVVFISDSQLCREIQKHPLDDRIELQVGHDSHTDDKYHFVISARIRNAPSLLAPSAVL